MLDRLPSSVYAGGTPTVRTRFAPSPTGEMHIGGYRTILFSWLLARHNGGQFILRVEDTDQKRTKDASIDHLLEGLRWIGLTFDEGPEIGGQVGPYYQSQRLALYAHYATHLLASGHVYRCFCTRERLEEMRAEQQARKVPTGYDRLCRGLSADEVNAKLSAGDPFVIRLKVPLTGTTSYIDALRGEMTFQNTKLDDTVLLKSDSYPTYHFANVIDDHAMAITHVLRGDDWLPSAPLHVMLYRALGWQMPVYAHVPNVMGNDNKKLGKRTGAEPVIFYRDRGYLPEAIINYLALLGWSYDDKTDILSVDQLIESFSLERVHVAGGIFDPKRLEWMNGKYIRDLPIEDLVERVAPYMERPSDLGGLPDHIQRPLDRAYLARIMGMDRERLKTLADAADLTSFFFDDHLEYPTEMLIGKGLDAVQARAGLQRARDLLASLSDWDHSAMESAMRALAEELGQKPGPLFMGVRVAITGRKETPPLFETLEALGRERSLARIEQAMAKL